MRPQSMRPAPPLGYPVWDLQLAPAPKRPSLKQGAAAGGLGLSCEVERDCDIA